MRRYYMFITGIYTILMAILISFLKDWSRGILSIQIISAIYLFISLYEVTTCKEAGYDRRVPCFNMLFANLILMALNYHLP